MNKLSEEEIKQRLNTLGYRYKLGEEDEEAIRQIQDLYKQEKENNKKIVEKTSKFIEGRDIVIQQERD